MKTNKLTNLLGATALCAVALMLGAFEALLRFVSGNPHATWHSVAFLTGQDYNLQTLNAYKVNRPGEAEVIRQRLYDFQLYPTAGAVQFTYFALPVGQGVTSSIGAVVGSVKTLADTNMDLAGQLARPKSYLCESIEIIVEPGSSGAANTFVQRNPATAAAAAAVAVLLDAMNDVNLLRLVGWLELYIGSKTYLTEAPLGTFPPKVRMEIDGSIGNADTTTHNAVAAMTGHWGGRPYYMEPPITLESMQNFSVFLKFPGVVATPSTFNARVGVAFDGVQYRLSQ